jgi:DNA-binding transcriptional ArsR family regulator
MSDYVRPSVAAVRCADLQPDGMDTASAVALMAMLGHGLRMKIWRTLLPYKSIGLSAGAIAVRTDMVPSSLSFHLQQMVKAGLLALRHDGRYTIYSVNTEIIVALCDYLSNAVGNGDQRRQGCSTLSTEGPLEECVDTAESGGVAILIER